MLYSQSISLLLGGQSKILELNIFYMFFYGKNQRVRQFSGEKLLESVIFLWKIWESATFPGIPGKIPVMAQNLESEI
jgi:hypothetical protein